MLVDFDTAVAVYERDFDAASRSPCLHPRYVEADARRDPSLEPAFFVFAEGAQVYYYAFHVGRVPGASLFDIQSPYGYGGPLANTEDRAFLERAWAALERWCAEKSVMAEFARFHPLLRNERFFHGKVVEDRQTVWIDLTVPELLASYSTRARTAIRKAQKQGLLVEWWEPDRFAPVFARLYREHMEFLNADEYYFFGEPYFESLLAWPQAHGAACILDGETVGGAIFLMGGHYVEYHLSAANASGRQMSATNLLVHEAALRGKACGARSMHLGGGTTADPDNPLLFFKSGFSPHRATFNIGKFTHLREQYDAMRAEWEHSGKLRGNRHLFYR